jgi:hypothetical protein
MQNRSEETESYDKNIQIGVERTGSTRMTCRIGVERTGSKEDDMQN